MASEEQIETLFHDCEPGAVPAIGAAYGLKVIVDDSLASEPEVHLRAAITPALSMSVAALFGSFWRMPDMRGSLDLLGCRSRKKLGRSR